MTRPILNEDILDIEDKRVFVHKMNYRISVPWLLVKINGTYYTKLSTLFKTTQLFDEKTAWKLGLKKPKKSSITGNKEDLDRSKDLSLGK